MREQRFLRALKYAGRGAGTGVRTRQRAGEAAGSTARETSCCMDTRLCQRYGKIRQYLRMLSFAIDSFWRIY